MSQCIAHNRRRDSSAFTLVEVLATLVLLGIVLPVAMRGLSVALTSAERARHSAEAASLGQAKLNELITTGQWSTTVVSGDFGQDWPEYRWSSQTYARDFGMNEIVLSVTWEHRGSKRSLNLATLVLEEGATQ